MIYSGQTAQIFLDGFRSNQIAIHREVGQGCPMSPVLFDIVIETLATAVPATEGIKGFSTPMRIQKLMLYMDDIVFFFINGLC